MEANPALPSARFPFIDAAKTLAIFLVIFYHIGTTSENASLGLQQQAWSFAYLLHGIGALAVPLFFVINGFLVLNRPLNLRAHFFKTLRLYVLTLIWSLIILLALKAIEGTSYSASEFLRAVFLLKHGDNNHLWFMFALASLYLLLPMIKAAVDYKNGNALLWTLVLMFVVSFGSIFANGCLNLVQIAIGHGIQLSDGRVKRFLPFEIQGVDPFSGYAWVFVYFIVGGIFAQGDRLPASRISWGVLLALFLIAAGALFGYGSLVSPYLDGRTFDTVFDGYNSIPGLMMTLSAFLILQKIWKVQGRAASLVSSIGRNTLGIYLLHIIVLRFANHESQALAGLRGVPSTFIYAVALLMVTWLATLALKRIPVISALFSI